jgi:hypothetical protein
MRIACPVRRGDAGAADTVLWHRTQLPPCRNKVSSRRTHTHTFSNGRSSEDGDAHRDMYQSLSSDCRMPMRASAASSSIASVCTAVSAPLWRTAACSAGLSCCRACRSSSSSCSPDACRQRSAHDHLPCDIAPSATDTRTWRSFEPSGGAHGAYADSRYSCESDGESGSRRCHGNSQKVYRHPMNSFT